MPYIAFRSPWARPVHVPYFPLASNPRGPLGRVRRNPMTREQLAAEGIRVIPSPINLLGQDRQYARERAEEIKTFLLAAYAIPTNVASLANYGSIVNLVFKGKPPTTRGVEEAIKSSYSSVQKAFAQNANNYDEDEEISRSVEVLNALLKPWTSKNDKYSNPQGYISAETYKNLVKDKPVTGTGLKVQRYERELLEATQQLNAAKAGVVSARSRKEEASARPLREADLGSAAVEIISTLIERSLRNKVFMWGRKAEDQREEMKAAAYALFLGKTDRDRVKSSLFTKNIPDLTILNVAYDGLKEGQKNIHNAVKDSVDEVVKQQRQQDKELLSSKPLESGEIVATQEQAEELNNLSPEALRESAQAEHSAALVANVLASPDMNPSLVDVVKAHLGKGNETRRFSSGMFVARKTSAGQDYRLSAAFEHLFGLHYTVRGGRVVLDTGTQPKSYHFDIRPGRAVLVNNKKGVVLSIPRRDQVKVQLDDGNVAEFNKNAVYLDNECPACRALAQAKHVTPQQIRQFIESDFAKPMRRGGYTQSVAAADIDLQQGPVAPTREAVDFTAEARKMLSLGVHLRDVALQQYQTGPTDPNLEIVLAHLGTEVDQPISRRFRISDEQGTPYSFQSTRGFQEFTGAYIDTRRLPYYEADPQRYASMRLSAVQLGPRFHFTLGPGSRVRVLRPGSARAEATVTGFSPIGRIMARGEIKSWDNLEKHEVELLPCPSCAVLARHYGREAKDIQQVMETFASRHLP